MGEVDERTGGGDVFFTTADVKKAMRIRMRIKTYGSRKKWTRILGNGGSGTTGSVVTPLELSRVSVGRDGGKLSDMDLIFEPDFWDGNFGTCLWDVDSG